MTTYLIGDVQGCFDSLQALLAKIKFDPQKDRLGFVGDLVNRGPKSLETLRFIYNLNDPLIVLGNHDLHLLALYFNNIPFAKHDHTLHDLLTAPDCPKLIDFLLHQPFLHLDTTHPFAMVHAGIPPQWSLTTAQQYAKEAAHALQKNPAQFLTEIYGNHPTRFEAAKTKWDQLRYIINAFTRMRFCTQSGALELNNKHTVSHDPAFRPWFEWVNPTIDIYFGHWASLKGQCHTPRIHALDTGCAWGELLTAQSLTGECIQIHAVETNK
jgi:bis(5'-nucleosyl)-tetraphosphatase (symmetrical)